ncbi:MAG: exodeoxyribonuclease VII small subunit [Chloroflexota bacterium]|nr:exodeoxyribonuclease VII small subunit [Chloroflexota bacterium]
MTSDDARNGAERKRRGQRAAEPAEPEQHFDALMRELESIVTSLEDGRLPLEESLALYERGMRLAKACQDRLDTAELRVRRLRIVAPASDEDATEYALDDFEPNGND